MRTRLILRTAAWALALIGLLGTATLAGQKDRHPLRVVVQDRIVCDENDDDCEGVVVEVDGNPSVFYVGDNSISAPRFAFSFGASGGYLGVSLVDLTPELRDHFGVPDDLGVMIARVEQDTPAEEAGLLVGDVVTAVDGEEVETSTDLSRLIRRLDDGDDVELEVYRDGRAFTLDAVVAERERSQFDFGQWLKIENDDGDDPSRVVLGIDPDTLKESMARFRTYWNDDDLKSSFGNLHTLEGDLAEKIEALEKRLSELEEQLEKRN